LRRRGKGRIDGKKAETWFLLLPGQGKEAIKEHTIISALKTGQEGEDH